MGKLSHLKKAIEGAKRRVYQGSPHKYDGKLDHSKIGTGEGAQAYGYGHYLAENPDVAKGYQDRLSDGMLETPDGEVFDVSDLEHLNVRARLRKNKGDVQKTLDSLVGVADDAPVETQAMLARDIAKLEQYKASGLKSGGHLYEFDLPESAIDNMLDWDAPLGEQPESVQDAISKARDNIRKLSPEYADNMDITGEGLYQLYREYRGGSSQAASEGLKELGITGIKYHDGMSRAAGEGTRNFVIFPGNEDMVKAVSRNGEKLSAAALAPLAGGIGLMGTFSEDAEAGKFRAVVDAAVNTTKRATDGYSTGHTAPYRDAEGYHSSLDDVTNMFGDDIYTANAKRYYGGDNAADEAIDIIQRHKGDPDALIDIYRAVPEGVSEFNSGDWVTISQDYARQHGDSHIPGDYSILKGQAKASDLFNEGYATEWGLDPAKKNSADLLASVGGAGVLGAAALSPEDARAAEPQFMDRVKNPQNYGYIENPDGSISTHRMAAEIDEDGRVYAFPTIVQMPDGKLKQFDDPHEALRYNKSIGNVVEFDDIQSAIDYTRNYKTKAFKRHYEQQNNNDQSNMNTRAAELDAIALQGERMRSLQGAWRSPEKRDKWKALKSGLYDNLVAPALEGMAAVNRGAVDTLNFVGPDQVNAILQLSGSEKRVPTLNNIPGIDEATAGNYMQEGLPRDIVRTGGEFLSPL